MLVLFVDSDPMTRRMYERTLRGKHTVHLAENGVEALKLIDAGIRFDAIISALEMNRMPGDILCLELRRRKITAPFLLLSSSDAVERIAKLVGATEYSMKGSSLIQVIFTFLKKIEDSKKA